jgi:O-methyltransferase
MATGGWMPGRNSSHCLIVTWHRFGTGQMTMARPAFWRVHAVSCAHEGLQRQATTAGARKSPFFVLGRPDWPLISFAAKKNYSMSNFYNTVFRPAIRKIGVRVGWYRRRKRKNESIPPDFDDLTLRVFEAVKDFTMTSPERVGALVQAVRFVVDHKIEGAIVECGVWRGGSTMAVALTLKALGDETREIYLSDTFAGMSAPTEDDVDIGGASAQPKFDKRKISEDSSNYCLSPLDETRENVFSTGYPNHKFHFVEGKVEDTIPATIPSGPIALLRLDTDWYESTKHELVHLFPPLAENGPLIIDDYGHWQGAKKAVDEYFQENNLRIFLSRIDYTGRIGIKPSGP